MAGQPGTRVSFSAAAGAVVAALVVSALVYGAGALLGMARTATAVGTGVAFLAVLLGGLRPAGMRPVELQTGRSSGTPEAEPWLWNEMVNPRPYLRRSMPLRKPPFSNPPPEGRK